MFFLGIISIFQAVLLPGLIIGFLVKKLRLVDRILLALPLSLVANYTLVLLMTLTGMYTRLLLVGIVILEIVTLCILLAKAKRAMPISFKQHGLQADSVDTSLILLVAVLMCFSLFFFYSAWEQIGTVFNIWDDVVSWNRWAVTWYHGELPHGTWQYPAGSQTYPQGIPILYSLTYKLIGDERVQFFSKAIAIIFPLFAYVTFFRVAFIFEQFRNVIILALSIFIWILSHGYSGMTFVFGGYADSPMAYFGVFSIYIFLLLFQRAKQVDGDLWSDPLCYLALIAVSAAALVKQPGVLLAAVFSLTLYFNSMKNQKMVLRNNILWLSLSFVSILVLHWYVYKSIQIYRGSESSIVSVYASLVSASWFMRPILGTKLLFSTIGWAWIPAFVSGLFNPHARRLALWALLPIFMFWAFFVSYDLRSLFLAFSWIAIILAVGCIKLCNIAYSNPKYAPIIFFWGIVLFIEIIYKSPALASSFFEFSASYEKIPIQLILTLLFGLVVVFYSFSLLKTLALGRAVKFTLAMALILLAAVCGIYADKEFTPEKLVANSIAQQQAIGYSKLNKFLLEYFLENEGGREYVATSYQFIGFIPGLQQHFKLAQCKDFSFLSIDAVQYYLYTPLCPVSDREQFEKVMGNNAEKIKDEGYVFYKIKH